MLVELASVKVDCLIVQGPTYEAGGFTGGTTGGLTVEVRPIFTLLETDLAGRKLELPGLEALMVQVPTLIAVTLLPLSVQYLVVSEVRVVVPEVSVVVRSAVGFAMDSQPKSESVSVLTALEMVNDLVTALAGLWVASPGLVAVILQTPEVRTFTVRLLTREQMVGVTEVVVVTPAL